MNSIGNVEDDIDERSISRLYNSIKIIFISKKVI